MITVTVLLDRGFSLFMDQVYQRVETGQSGGKVNYLLNHYDSIGTLAVGNSRCAHHIVPDAMGKNTYNLSHNGMSLMFHTGLIDQLLKNEHIHIDTLLLHLETYELLNTDPNKSRDVQHLKFYYGKNDWIRKEINDLSGYEQIKFLLSSYRWNGKTVSLAANWVKTLRSTPPQDGYVASPPTPQDSLNVIRQLEMTSNEPAISNVEQMNPHTISYLNHIQELCSKSGTTLICFTSPVFQGWRYGEAQQSMIHEYFDKRGIPFLDYSNDPSMNEALGAIENWKDLIHMNERGALIFTNKLKEDLSKANSTF